MSAVVFAGHVQNYQRGFPLTFVPAVQPDGAVSLLFFNFRIGANGAVEKA